MIKSALCSRKNFSSLYIQVRKSDKTLHKEDSISVLQKACRRFVLGKIQKGGRKEL